ncbi:MAG: phosphoserine transaminase [Varibaculum cambriense]|uniref:phosphoserine transaminase n=1 Tax=Varibaculum cambriense TaxID=184870 RepID=UPI001ED2AA8A|nr:phosphoserine transaminase [Varibaculum cambriense]MBS5919130.1 phosphoserine transaminase [Varibaculum cambriense]
MENFISIPADLLPENKKFGAGPSSIRKTALAKVAASDLPGTSHRQAPVKDLVGSLRGGLKELFSLPDGYEVVLGNGGATSFWAVAASSLIRERSAHAVFGSFGAKFAETVSGAPHLKDPMIELGGISARAQGQETASDIAILRGGQEGIDTYCYPAHETSTGALSPVNRIAGGLNLVDATSIAGGAQVDISQTDVYYFSGQKCFAAEGGLWVALASPAAQERAQEIKENPGAGRWIPPVLDFSVALKNSVKNQTLNTPAISTLILWEDQVQWMLEAGGLATMEERTRTSSAVLYEWADSRPEVCPYIANPREQSPVVVTIDFKDIDADTVIAQLRANGIVDIDPYRALGQNQIRVACFPNIEVADTQALTACLDYVIDRL